MSALAAIFSPDATTQFKQIACCHEGCGALFAVPAETQKRLIQTHEWFYCPFGHRQRYSGDNEVEALKKAIVAERAALDQARAKCRYYTERALQLTDEKHCLKHRLSATRGVVTKIKKRVGRGVCPCCNRRFVQLADHMAAKHPDYHQAIQGDEAATAEPKGDQ